MFHAPGHTRGQNRGLYHREPNSQFLFLTHTADMRLIRHGTKDMKPDRYYGVSSVKQDDD
ncbi:hypothetical protein GCM10022398_31330 [Acetobacter lovaniensis]|nr:hypothetical protein AA0474_2133 [Acetobacter lovaniensis NRIC 0474]